MIFRYALLCDYSNETNDGKLNCFGVTDAVFAFQFPAVHKHCHLVLSMIVEPVDFGQTRVVEIDFIDMDGNRILGIQAPVACGDRRQVMNHRHLFHDLQLPRAGSYQFTIRIDGREVAEVPWEAHQIERPAP